MEDLDWAKKDVQLKLLIVESGAKMSSKGDAKKSEGKSTVNVNEWWG